MSDPSSARPLGLRAALGTIFLATLESDFAEKGQEAIERLRKDRPHEYIKLVLSLLPDGALADKIPHKMTDDEILEFALELKALGHSRPGGAAHKNSEGGEKAGDGKSP